VWLDCIKDFRGFQDVDVVHKIIVKLFKEAKIDNVDVEDMKKLFKSHTEELTNEELQQIRQQCIVKEKHECNSVTEDAYSVSATRKFPVNS